MAGNIPEVDEADYNTTVSADVSEFQSVEEKENLPFN